MAKKPSFITNTVKNRRPDTTRPFKWGPGIPSLAITFKEIPGESLIKTESGEILETVLGTQDFFALGTQDSLMIQITLP